MKKKLLKIFIVISIFLIMVLGLYMCGMYVYQTYQDKNNREIKTKFNSYILQNNFQKTFDNEFIGKILDRMQNESYSSLSQIKFENTFSLESSLDLNKLILDIETSHNNDSKDVFLKLKYSNNDLFNVKVLQNNKYISFYNEEILNNNLVIKKEELLNTLNKINDNYGKTYSIFNSKVNDLKIKRNDSNNISNNKYLEIINDKVKAQNCIDKGTAIIEQNGRNIETNVYSLEMSKSEFISLYTALSNELLKDDEIINAIKASGNIANQFSVQDFENSLNYKTVVKDEVQTEIHAFRESDATNRPQTVKDDFALDKIELTDVSNKVNDVLNKINDTTKVLVDNKEQISLMKNIYCMLSKVGTIDSSEKIQRELGNKLKDISELLKENLKFSDKVNILLYVSNGETIKTSILIGNKYEVHLDYITNSESSDESKISVLSKVEGKYEGYTVDLLKSKNRFKDITQLELDKIFNSEIVEKYELKIDLSGSDVSNEFKENEIKFVYSGNNGTFSAKLDNKLSFKNVETGVIDSTNSLILNNLGEKEFNYTVNKLNYRLNNYYNDKMSKLNLITTNTSDTILKNDESVVATQVNEEEKNRIIDVLVNEVSNKMGEAQENGEEYTLKDLKNLQIEGYDVQVTVSQELAIVKINGYKFKIDKDFNLSE